VVAPDLPEDQLQEQDEVMEEDAAEVKARRCVGGMFGYHLQT
jgi:hypothetical protein